jgi:hypothetical protein
LIPAGSLNVPGDLTNFDNLTPYIKSVLPTFILEKEEYEYQLRAGGGGGVTGFRVHGQESPNTHRISHTRKMLYKR